MSSCSGKNRYDTEQKAKDVSTQVWYDRRVSTRVYACRLCGGFHLTSQNADPKMKPGWRIPRISQREVAARRRRNRHRK